MDPPSLPEDEIVPVPEELVREWFGDDGPLPTLARVGTRGDGSCFYASLLAAVSPTYLLATRARRAELAHQYRCTFRSKLKPADLRRLGAEDTGRAAFVQAAEDFCRSRVWADETHIKFAREDAERNIIFVDFTTGKLHCGVHAPEVLEGEAIETVIIAWVRREHFETMVRLLPGDLPGTVLVRTTFDPADPVDRRLIERLSRRYADGCELPFAPFAEEAV